MQTKIKGRLYSFQSGETENLQTTVLRNIVAITTMDQDEYDEICDHDISEEERWLLENLFTEWIISDSNEYTLTPAGYEMVEKMLDA